MIVGSSDSHESVDDTRPVHIPVRGPGPYSLLSVPLISGGQPIGVLYLLSLQEDAFAEGDLSLAQRVSHLIAGAISNAQLYQDAQQRAEEVLRLSEFNERVIASAPAALAVLQGSDHTVTSVNPAFARAFISDGRSAEESIEGRPLVEVVPMEDLPAFIEETSSAGEPVGQREMHYIDPAGVERWFLASATPLRGEGRGERSVNESLLILDDITEQRQHQEALQETARLASIGQPGVVTLKDAPDAVQATPPARGQPRSSPSSMAM